MKTLTTLTTKFKSFRQNVMNNNMTFGEAAVVFFSAMGIGIVALHALEQLFNN